MDEKILIHSANSPDVYHWGIHGQQWGKRRYQNEDGSLTPLGRIHYGVGEAKERSKIKIREMKAETKSAVKLAKAQAKAAKAVADAEKEKIAAKTKEYRDRKEADNIVELERIKAQREADRMDAKNEAQLNKNLAEATKENAEVENKSSAVKAVLGIMAAAGVGYLIYKAVSNGSSSSNKEAATKAISKVSDKPASEVTTKASNTIAEAAKSEKGKKWLNDNDVYERLTKDGVLSPKTAKEFVSKVFTDGTTRVHRNDLEQTIRKMISSGFAFKHSDNNDLILVHSAKGPDIYHYGVKGQKRGIRRYQNEDGSYTMAGKYRYGIGVGGNTSGPGTNQDPGKLRDKLDKSYTPKASEAGAYKVYRQAEGQLIKDYVTGHARDREIYEFGKKWGIPHTVEEMKSALDKYVTENVDKGYSRKRSTADGDKPEQYHYMRNPNTGETVAARNKFRNGEAENSEIGKNMTEHNKTTIAKIIKNKIDDKVPKTTLRDKLSKDSKKADLGDLQDFNRTFMRDADKTIGRAMEQDLVKKHLNGTATDKDYEDFIKRYAPNDGHTYTVDELKKMIDKNAGNGKTKTNSASKEQLNKPEKSLKTDKKTVQKDILKVISKWNGGREQNGIKNNKDTTLNNTKPIGTKTAAANNWDRITSGKGSDRSTTSKVDQIDARKVNGDSRDRYNSTKSTNSSSLNKPTNPAANPITGKSSNAWTRIVNNQTGNGSKVAQASSKKKIEETDRNETWVDKAKKPFEKDNDSVVKKKKK